MAATRVFRPPAEEWLSVRTLRFYSYEGGEGQIRIRSGVGAGNARYGPSLKL